MESCSGGNIPYWPCCSCPADETWDGTFDKTEMAYSSEVAFVVVGVGLELGPALMELKLNYKLQLNSSY